MVYKTYKIFDQLITFLTDNKLFCMEQFGFRPGHSTELAALRLVDHLTTILIDTLQARASFDSLVFCNNIAIVIS